MAIKIADVLLTTQTINVGQPILIEVKLTENNWQAIKEGYSTWQDIINNFRTWLDLKEN